MSVVGRILRGEFASGKHTVIKNNLVGIEIVILVGGTRHGIVQIEITIGQFPRGVQRRTVTTENSTCIKAGGHAVNVHVLYVEMADITNVISGIEAESAGTRNTVNGKVGLLNQREQIVKNSLYLTKKL